MSVYAGAFSGRYPISRRASIGCSTISKPPTLTVPSVGGMKPVIIRMVVDLPAPFGPRKPKTSPRSIENEIPSTARLAPKAFAKLLTFIIVSASFLHEANSPDTQFRLTCKLVSWTVVLSASFWIRANALDNLGLVFGKDVQKNSRYAVLGLIWMEGEAVGPATFI